MDDAEKILTKMKNFINEHVNFCHTLGFIYNSDFLNCLNYNNDFYFRVIFYCLPFYASNTITKYSASQIIILAKH